MVRRALVAILWLCPALAVAQNAPAAKTDADKLFDEGKSLRDAGEIDRACSKFEESLRLLDRFGVRMNLADCHERQGRTATAWAEFREAASQATERGDNRAAHARERADKLAPRLRKLAISVASDSQLPGLAVRRDGVAVPSKEFGRPIPVDPGNHIVEASAPGYQAWSTHVDVTKPGQVVPVEVPRLAAAPERVEPPKTATAPAEVEPSKSLMPRAEVPAASPVDVDTGDVGPRASTPSDPRAASRVSPQRSSKLVPLVLGTATLALLGGGLGFELWAESSYDAAKSEMTSQPRRESLYNSAIDKRYAAAVLAGSGLAAGGVAVWLYVRGDHRERDATTNASVHVAPTTTGLVLSGQF